MIYYLYGGGMPLMYGLGVLFFLTSYLNYKWLLFYWYRTAHGFNEDVALNSISLMKWALLAHLLMSLFMYTNRRVLTPTDYTPAEYYRPIGEAPGKFFSRRFDRPQPKAVAAMVFGLLILYLFWKTIINGCIYIFVTRKKKKKNLDEEDNGKGGDPEA